MFMPGALAPGTKSIIGAQINTTRNIKAICLALAAVFAFSAIAAGAAQADAPRWTVGGVTINAEKKETVTGESTGTPTLANASATFSSTSCTSHGSIQGSAAGKPGLFTGTLLCHEVKVVGAAACIVKSAGQPNGTVTTTNLNGTLVWLNEKGDEKVGMLYQGDGSTHFATLVVEGCALAGSYPVDGEIIGEATPITKDEVNGTINFPAVPILKHWSTEATRKETAITQLKLKAAKATFVCHIINIHLTGNALWGIEPG